MSHHRNIPGLVTALALALAPTIAAAENVGTSCADCPSYNGSFSIENTTGILINYEEKWGSDRPWKKMQLDKGKTMTHSFPMGDNRNARLPTPYIRFDRIGGDARYTAQEYKMEFHAVGYAGFGAGARAAEPKRYVFRFAPDGKHLDVKEK